MSISKVVFMVGWLLIPLPALMCIIVLYCALTNDIFLDSFIISVLVCAIIVVFMVVPLFGKRFNVMTLSEMYTVISLLLTIGSLFAALPMFFSMGDSHLSFYDALFEAVSGLTTNGGTAIPRIDEMPSSILLWRSVLQWVGGVWTILASILVIPLMQGGRGIPFSDKSDIEYNRQTLPNIVDFSYHMIMIYSILTLVLVMLYWGFGMSLFDAINHSFTTVSTGGFSTHSSSFMFFNSKTLEIIAVVFMIISSMPFMVIILGFKEYKPYAVFLNSQVLTMLITLGAASILVYYLGYMDDFIAVLFTTVSFMTGTGYSLYDVETYSGMSACMVLLFVMIIGGCSNSTTCGIRVFRVQIIFKIMAVRIKALVNHGTLFRVSYDGVRCNEVTIGDTVAFTGVYLLLLFISVVLFTYMGMDLLTSISTSVSAVSNVGPAIGDSVGGSMGTYYYFDNISKMWMVLLMLMGRLELFAFIVACAFFWKAAVNRVSHM